MSVYLADPDVTVYCGDVLDELAQLDDGSVDCVVTSPPYWGLRDYGVSGQLGLEPTPEEYIARMVAVFREIRRVLAPYGTLWLNIGDTYHGGGGGNYGTGLSVKQGGQHLTNVRNRLELADLKPKDLIGIPWRLAFALQADGWWLRSDVIWSKPNPMPESVTDRPTKAHEYVFLLTKAARYFYDADAVREPHARDWAGDAGLIGSGKSRWAEQAGRNDYNGRTAAPQYNPAGRNLRSVWEIATEAFPDAHFATYPTALVERCLKAGCPSQVCRTCGKPRERIVERTGAENERVRTDVGENGAIPSGIRSLSGATYQRVARATEALTDCGHDNYRPGIVLDPFIGSGTTAFVARKLGRHTIGIELNEDYCALAARRLAQQSLLAEASA